MAFVVGIVLFVIVLGIVDAGLPWPAARTDRTARR